MTTQPSDNGVGSRSTTAPGTTAERESYAVPRSPRRRPPYVVPAAAVGLGLALGGAALVVLQSF